MNSLSTTEVPISDLSTQQSSSDEDLAQYSFERTENVKGETPGMLPSPVNVVVNSGSVIDTHVSDNDGIMQIDGAANVKFRYSPSRSMADAHSEMQNIGITQDSVVFLNGYLRPAIVAQMAVDAMEQGAKVVAFATPTSQTGDFLVVYSASEHYDVGDELDSNGLITKQAPGANEGAATVSIDVSEDSTYSRITIRTPQESTVAQHVATVIDSIQGHDFSDGTVLISGAVPGAVNAAVACALVDKGEVQDVAFENPRETIALGLNPELDEAYVALGFSESRSDAGTRLVIPRNLERINDDTVDSIDPEQTVLTHVAASKWKVECSKIEQPLKFAIVGPPHSGKSVLSKGLLPAFQSMEGFPTPVIIAGCPDGEAASGAYPEVSSTNMRYATEMRNEIRGTFSEEFVDETVRQIKGSRVPLALVDLGGRPSDENERILTEGGIDGVILIGSDSPELKGKIDEWKALLRRLDVPLVADITSKWEPEKSLQPDAIHGTEFGGNTTLCGTISTLDRERDPYPEQRTSIQLLARHLAYCVQDANPRAVRQLGESHELLEKLKQSGSNSPDGFSSPVSGRRN
jgi:hypothetical protein